jgi:hypothetical protein
VKNVCETSEYPFLISLRGSGLVAFTKIDQVPSQIKREPEVGKMKLGMIEVKQLRGVEIGQFRE